MMPATVRACRRSTPASGCTLVPVVMGDIGANRLEFAVIGNTVNVASRLEAMSRAMNVTLVVSDVAYHKAVAQSSPEQVARFAHMVANPALAIRGLDAPMVLWTA